MKDILAEKYMALLGDAHDLSETPSISVKLLDFSLRKAIGKTNDLRIPLASHAQIISRELKNRVCRVCSRGLTGTQARYNDYLVLRHPNCKSPICLDCSKNKPDAFHKAFKRGLEAILE